MRTPTDPSSPTGGGGTARSCGAAGANTAVGHELLPCTCAFQAPSSSQPVDDRMVTAVREATAGGQVHLGPRSLGRDLCLRHRSVDAAARRPLRCWRDRWSCSGSRGDRACNRRRSGERAGSSSSSGIAAVRVGSGTGIRRARAMAIADGQSSSTAANRRASGTGGWRWRRPPTRRQSEAERRP